MGAGTDKKSDLFEVIAELNQMVRQGKIDDAVKSARQLFEGEELLDVLRAFYAIDDCRRRVMTVS